MAEKKLSVYLHDKHIGSLSQDISGKMKFVYDNNAINYISMSLPLKKDAFNENECFGYFNGLLPESKDSRKFLGKKYGINANNDFNLLRAIGHDCAGAVSFYDEYEKKADNKLSAPKGTPISSEDLAKHIKELPSNPLFMGVKDLRVSLAGVQDKASISVIDGNICVPEGDTPTTHILKPAVSTLDQSVENEYLCMKVAEKTGIKIPDVSIGYAQDVKYLLIGRYDRKIYDRHISRIHQEDFCQALGFASAYKYQNDGGPGFLECFKLLRRLSTPAVDINKFVDMIIFNFLICNNDAHGKNFSILHEYDGSYLAPAYDILCTKIYGGLTDKMAMKVGGHYNIFEIQPRHWERMCDEVKFSFPVFKKLMSEKSRLLPEIIYQVTEEMKSLGYDIKICGKILSCVKDHCENNNKMFKNY